METKVRGEEKQKQQGQGWRRRAKKDQKDCGKRKRVKQTREER